MVSGEPDIDWRTSDRRAPDPRDLQGRVYANLGSWNGEQIVPVGWIRESTSGHPVDNPGGDPYGYLWRIIPADAGLGYGFYHTGLGVHLLAILPEADLVVVHRVDTDRPFDTTWGEIRTLLEMVLNGLGLLPPA